MALYKMGDAFVVVPEETDGSTRWFFHDGKGRKIEAFPFENYEDSFYWGIDIFWKWENAFDPADLKEMDYGLPWGE